MGTDKRILGIDYGSKMAGTTVVAYMVENQVTFLSSEKGKDADAMILRLSEELKPDLVAIDAPLSLPGVYTNQAECTDYFYRECDKLSKAMSPMFLGGLTARAMKLAAKLRDWDIEVIEAYPVKTGNDLGLKAFGYRSKQSDSTGLVHSINEKTGIDLTRYAKLSSHQVDAALALHIGRLQATDRACKLGSLPEGIIYY